MQFQTMQTTISRHWRLLSAIEYVEGGTTYAARLMETQGGSILDLTVLVKARLIAARFGGVEVEPDQVPPKEWTRIDIALTYPGEQLLRTDPWWRVLRFFTLYAPRNGGHPVASVRKIAAADDTQLREMESRGFVDAFEPRTHDPIPLSAFPKRIPPMVRLQLTDKSRRYLPRR